MFEKIIIKNFIFLSNVDLEISRYNIIIGPQGSGKSIITKLIAFCRTSITHQLFESLIELEDKRTYNKRLIQLFQRHFPKYSWENTDLNIEYHYNNSIITITSLSKSGKLSINISDDLCKARNKIIKEYKNLIENNKKNGERRFYKHNIIRELIHKRIPFNMGNWNYIPATRSYFSNLERRIFSFISDDNAIDPMLSSFGALYEDAKLFHSFESQNEKPNYEKKIDHIIEKVIGGGYKQEKGDDWIHFNEKKKRKIKITHASSGQQEALPILMVLNILPRHSQSNTGYIIEEPESHLFPIAQKYMLDAFSCLYNNFLESKIFITTHSPYILAAINNQLMSFLVLEKNHNHKIDFIDKDFIINPSDLKAYYLADGKIKSIMDKETNLINASAIDSASEVLDKEFDRLIELYD